MAAGGPSGVREWVGLARSSTAPTVGLLEMHDSRPHPFPRGVTAGIDANGRDYPQRPGRG